jgi:hypothetical protein
MKQPSPEPPREMSRAAVLRALAALREQMDANPAVPVPEVWLARVQIR